MRAIEATVTSQGQVTIPAEVRRHLGLEKRAKVTFLIEDSGVRLVLPRFTLASAFGSIEPIPGTSVDFDREIEEAMEDHADQVVSRLRTS